MPQQGESGTSKCAISIAYAKAAYKDDHAINVESLGPALIAFGKLIKEANNSFNAKKSTSSLYVISDFEHKCFNINFEIITQITDIIKTLIESEPVKNAREILEQIGLLKPSSAIGSIALSYLAYLKWKNGRKIEKIENTNIDGNNYVKITIDGSHNHINMPIYNMSNNAKALSATRDAFNPIGHDNFDKIEIRQDDKIIDNIDEAEIQSIIASCNSGIIDSEEEKEELEETSAWLSVYSPVFDQSAPSWRFKLGTDTVYADISETTIALEALSRGGVSTNDAYQVRLEIRTSISKKGKKDAPHYKIISVIKFVPGSSPMPMETKLI